MINITARRNSFSFLRLSSFVKMTSPVERVVEEETNDLSIPSTVQGMKVLDRDKFRKEVKIHCYFFENNKASKALRILKRYLLKVNGFHPIQEGHETCCRVAYLDPIKVPNGFTDFEPSERIALTELGFPQDTSVRKVQLGYEQFKADEILRAVIPKEFDSVSGYSIIGHIVHLNLRPELEEYKSIIGSVLLDKVPYARTIVVKTDNIESTFRHFKMEVIAGEEDFNATVRENKCMFSLDFSKVYWNPRLSNEHQKVVGMMKKGDFLFDVFCGIGPFVVPSAKKGVRCFANDLNPSSVAWLETNIQTNKVSEANISIWCLDGKRFIVEVIKPALLEFAPGNYKIIVVMNLPALAPSFVSVFHRLFSEEEYERITTLSVPIARVYCFVKCPEEKNNVEAKKLVETSMNLSLDDEIERIDFVRNVAPNKDMMAVQMRLTKRILVGSKRPKSSCIERPCKKPSVSPPEGDK